MIRFAVLCCVAHAIPASAVLSQEMGPKPHQPYAERLPGTAFALEMLPIPGGTFEMGAKQREKASAKTRARRTPSSLRPSG